MEFFKKPRGNVEIFLDYDGTLTPLVDDPFDATLTEESRAVLSGVAKKHPVAIVSGRAAAEVKALVGISSLTYAGSHGHEIIYGDGSRYDHPPSTELVGSLDSAETALHERLSGLDGVLIERKPFAIAVHTRLVADQHVIAIVDRAVAHVASEIDRLAVTTGKDVRELRPAVDWNKGSAIELLLADSKARPLFIGDDATDEDGFVAARELGGSGIVVSPAVDRLTSAEFHLADPSQVILFLSLLS